MREVLNTVGKPGKLGEHVRCVVSVSMLTEGWDCNTVTHILGVRAFGTRLLCEQVMGRGLRRRSYAVGDDGMIDPGIRRHLRRAVQRVPGRRAGRGARPRPRRSPARPCERVPERLVDAPLARSHLPPRRRLPASTCRPNGSRRGSTDAPRGSLTTQDIPTTTLNAPIVGEKAELTLDEARRLRPQAVAFRLATHLQQHHFPDKPWLFPQLLGIVRDWLGDPDG